MSPDTKIIYQLEVAYRIKDGAYSSLNPDFMGGTLLFDDSNNFIIKSSTGDVEFVGEISKTTFQISGYGVILWCDKQIEFTPELYFVGKGGVTEKEFRHMLIYRPTYLNMVSTIVKDAMKAISQLETKKVNETYLKKQIHNIKTLLSSGGAKKRASKILYFAIILVILFFIMLYIFDVNLCKYDLIGCRII